MATLVHDDVLDAAPLRRGPPDGRRRAGPLDGDRGRRPAVLARVRRARRAGGDRAPGGPARRRLGRPAQGELAQRRDAFDLAISAERYLERCRLKTAQLFECACLIGAEPGADGTRALRDLRARDRARLPAARRRPRRHRPAGADRQGAGHRPARRHGDPAADPRPRARPGLASAGPARRSTRRRPRRLCERIAATGVLDAVRADARRRVEAAKAVLEAAPADGAAAGAADDGRRRGRRALPPRSPRGGSGPRSGRRRSARPALPCSPGSAGGGRRAAPRCRGRAPRRSGRRAPGCRRRHRSTSSRGSAGRRASASRSAGAQSTG